MRKIIVFSMISLDCVMQAPGGPDEDRSGSFAYGGWVAPYSDEIFSSAVAEELQDAEYLLGRKTFELWENYWPHHGDFWPGINKGMKYVLSSKRSDSTWSNSSFIQSVEEIRALKEIDAADLHVWGSSELVPLLLQHELVDELHLKIFPIVLGAGKRLFADESAAQSFRLMQCRQTSTGVVLANYEYAGEVRVAQIGLDK